MRRWDSADRLRQGLGNEPPEALREGASLSVARTLIAVKYMVGLEFPSGDAPLSSH
jgi:hypothetical protein